MRRPLAAFLIGAAVTLSGPLASLAGDADALVAKGKSLLEKRDWAAAKETFLAAVAKDGTDVEARRGAAEALLQTGSPDEAVSQAFAGLDLVKDADASLWLLAARSFLYKGETLPAGRETEISDSLADAKAKASEALKRDPSLVYAQVVLAKACRLSGDFERAGQTLAAALEKHPKDFELQMEKGLLSLKKKEYTAAALAFGVACEADPKSAEAHLQMGITQAFMGQWDEANAGMVRASVLDPANLRPLDYLAKWDRKGTSIAWYRKILKENNQHAWAHAYLAYYLARNKDEAGALTESKTAMALQNENANLISWHGQVLEALGRAEEARTWYRKAMDRDPGNQFGYRRLSEFAFVPGSGASADDCKAIADFLVRKRPQDGLLWNNVGLLYRDTARDHRKSLDAYLKAAELLPSDQGVQNDTGLMYAYYGKAIGEDPRKALPYFQNCLRLVEDENQPPKMGYRDTLENLSFYYMEIEKDPERALQYAEKRNDPEFLASLPKEDATPSPRATTVKAWAEAQLKKR